MCVRVCVCVCVCVHAWTTRAGQAAAQRHCAPWRPPLLMAPQPVTTLSDEEPAAEVVKSKCVIVDDMPGAPKRPTAGGGAPARSPKASDSAPADDQKAGGGAKVRDPAEGEKAPAVKKAKTDPAVGKAKKAPAVGKVKKAPGPSSGALATGLGGGAPASGSGGAPAALLGGCAPAVGCARKVTRKKPAADAAAKVEGPAGQYRLMKYAKKGIDGTMAIRAAKGRQFAEVNVKGATLAQNSEVAQAVLDELNKGVPEQDARELLDMMKAGLAEKICAC